MRSGRRRSSTAGGVETEALADVVTPDVSGRQLADLTREDDVLDPGTTF